MRRSTRVAAALVLTIAMMGGCATAPTSQEGKDELIRRAAAVLREWNRDTPGVEGFARQSYGYALFPEVAKGGLGVGAAYGRGVVYEQGGHVGYAELTQASLGLQVGGFAYQLLVVFDDRAALERFKQGRLDFSADASGVVLKTGYVAHVRFIEGLSVFARPVGGAMWEAALGGQRFTFAPSDDRDPAKPAPGPGTP